MSENWVDNLQANLTNESCASYAEDCINSAFESADFSSLRHVFNVRFSLENGFCDMIPMYPVSGKLANLTATGEVASRVQSVLASAFFPLLTFNAQPYLVAEQSNTINSARGLRFFFSHGTAQRYVFDKLSDYSPLPVSNGFILPMQAGFGQQVGTGIEVSPRTSSNMLIAGASGTGKTITLLGIIELARKYGEESLLTVIDGKNDFNLRNYCQKHPGITYLAPSVQTNGSVFLSAVNKTLSKYENLISRRAHAIASGEKTVHDFPFATLVVDESLAFLESASKSEREDFLSLQARIVLLSRAEKVQYIVSSQNFQAGSNGNITSVARDNIQNIIVLSPNNLKSDGRLVFSEEELNSIVVPRDNITNKGIGVIKTADSFVTPFLAPYFRSLD